MIQVSNQYVYFYDSQFDDLIIKFNTDVPVYSEEIYNNIYIIRSELDDSIIGTQILYFKKRSDTVLKNYLPHFIYQILSDLELS